MRLMDLCSSTSSPVNLLFLIGDKEVTNAHTVTSEAGSCMELGRMASATWFPTLHVFAHLSSESLNSSFLFAAISVQVKLSM